MRRGHEDRCTKTKMLHYKKYGVKSQNIYQGLIYGFPYKKTKFGGHKLFFGSLLHVSINFFYMYLFLRNIYTEVNCHALNTYS